MVITGASPPLASRDAECFSWTPPGPSRPYLDQSQMWGTRVPKFICILRLNFIICGNRARTIHKYEVTRQEKGTRFHAAQNLASNFPSYFSPQNCCLFRCSFPTSYESFRCTQYPQFLLLSHLSTARYFARPSVSSHRKGPANQVTFPLHVQTDPRCSEEGRERQTTHTKDSHQLCSQHLSCWQ